MSLRLLENVLVHPLRLGWDFFVCYLVAKRSLLALSCTVDKKHLKRLLISNNSVAGMATLVLLVLSPVSPKFNHCSFIPAKFHFVLQHWFGDTASKASDIYPRDRRQLIWVSSAADLWPSLSIHKFSAQHPDGIRNRQLQCCKLLLFSKSGKTILCFINILFSKCCSWVNISG